ncbi:MAG: FAD-binding protein [Rhodobacteraceae bacterium]|nr:FAD-binding protein [Paracoccaceae bacterium]
MRPDTEAELAELVKTASGPIEIIGGGTRKLGEHVEGVPLLTGGLSGITLYEPEALTLVAKAGTPLAEINALLAKNNQRLPFEPLDYRALQGSAGEPTIGGAVATNASGPRRISAGACRDSLIGVRFVDGMGRIIKNGGRVMKNVTGYDLVKLLAGSHGTLGILTEVSFKLLPAALATATVLVAEDETTAATTMARALGSPYDISGAGHIAGTTALRLEGLEGSVAYRSEALAALLSGKVGDFDWRALCDVQAFAGFEGDVWRFSVPPSQGPVLGAALRKLGAIDIIYDWAGGLVWALSPDGLDLRPALESGHGTVVRGTATPRFHPEPAPVAALASALRARFDPRGILNPGRMG